ncbi:MAG: bifunctional 2-polyprenyl-6-hydroxyphenol methylase/3-demethylubiquinol 3-O-methyltransferase UbiG [Labrys sp. (in: a-proteobacteria)]
MSVSDNAAGVSVDAAEVERFGRLAAEWWNPRGKFKPLHKFNPVRLSYIKREIAFRFGRDDKALDALTGLSVIDIGCGGGLIAEPLARLGATVTGVDAARTNIEVAKIHAGQSGLAIDYRCTTAEGVEATGERYDVVLALEIVEHVVDPAAFLRSCAALVKPGGLLFVATLNRTMKAYALAIIGAEYVLGWLPKGTHQWEKFVTPGEIESALVPVGLSILDRQGVVFNPLRDEWRLARDMDVNYMILAGRD